MDKEDTPTNQNDHKVVKKHMRRSLAFPFPGKKTSNQNGELDNLAETEVSDNDGPHDEDNKPPNEVPPPPPTDGPKRRGNRPGPARSTTATNVKSASKIEHGKFKDKIKRPLLGGKKKERMELKDAKEQFEKIVSMLDDHDLKLFYEFVLPFVKEEVKEPNQ